METKFIKMAEIYGSVDSTSAFGNKPMEAMSGDWVSMLIMKDTELEIAIGLFVKKDHYDKTHAEKIAEVDGLVALIDAFLADPRLKLYHRLLEYKMNLVIAMDKVKKDASKN